MHAHATDRLAGLRQLSPADLAELLRTVPAVSDALAGSGPLAPIGFGRGHAQWALPTTMPALARLLASRSAVHATLTALDRFHLQLVTLAAWHGGALTREQALAEAGTDRADALEAAADRLARLLVADRSRAWLALRPGVAAAVGVPGLPARPWLERNGTDRLADRLRRLGRSVPARKTERVDAVEAALRDPATMGSVVADAPADAARLLRLLAEHGPQPLADLGETSYRLHRDGPVAWLLERGLVVVTEDERVHVWLDVAAALRGSLYSSWQPDSPPVTPQPLAAPGAQLPAVLTQLAALLDRWAREPAPALSAGGLGVRPIRAAAKTLALPAGTVGLLAHLAHAMGLLGTVETAVRGRGRTRQVDLAYAPTPLAATFAQRPAAERWVRLVTSWRHDDQLDEADGLPERVAGDRGDATPAQVRAALLDALTRLPPEHGVTTGELVDLAGFRHPSRPVAALADGVVAGARALGLVPPDGPVGLTALGRAALEGVDAVEATLPTPSRAFTVQADHTIIAPPDLDPALTATLERYAACESDAGARVYRLDETRLAAALDAGDTAESIEAFLTDHATAPVAGNVTHLIGDVARRHGRVRAGACQSYVRCDDAALLARAAAVKPAKLRTVAPTVAVSSLPRAKLVAALRAKGLMPVAEDADGVALADAPAVGEPAWDADDALAPLPAAGERTDVDALAKRVLEHPDDDPDPGHGRQLLLLPGGERL